MAKIKVSTVRQFANVQVVNLNASFVAKVVRAKYELETVAMSNNIPAENMEDLDCMMTVSPKQLGLVYDFINELYTAMLDEEEPKKEEQPEKDEEANHQ